MKKLLLSPPSISAIVPALNEAPRIAAVLSVLTTYPQFSEIIVIDDGSTDQTGEIARQFPIMYLKNQTNQGKGAAMERAVTRAKGDIIFFCDADVEGLTHNIIDEIIHPLLTKNIDMSIAMRHHVTLEKFPWLLHWVFWLGGERALTKQLWQKIPAYYKYQFRIESALNFYARHHGRGLTYRLFPSLRQPTKDKKRGFLKGNWQRLIFIGQILSVEGKLRLVFVINRNEKTIVPYANTLDSP